MPNVGNIEGFPRYATNKDEATHKFPTSVYWGEGYFDGMRHIVANNSIDAYNAMRYRRPDCDWHNLWRKEKGEWVNCKDLAE